MNPHAAAAERLAREVRAARERTGELLALVEPRSSSVHRAPPPRRPSHAPARRDSFAPVVVLSSSSSSSPVSSTRRFSIPRVKAPPVLLLGGGLLGLGLLFVLLSRGKAAAAPASPSSSPPPSPPPSSPPSSSSPPASSPPPAAPLEPLEPVADWQVGSNGLTVLNKLSGYHRSTSKERGPEAIAKAASFLNFPIKTVHFETLDGGRQYAFAVEEHNNHPDSIGPKNKGVSIFVADA